MGIGSAVPEMIRKDVRQRKVCIRLLWLTQHREIAGGIANISSHQPRFADTRLGIELLLL
jgi:hypothetical protein